MLGSLFKVIRCILSVSFIIGQQPCSLGLWRLTYGRLECGVQVSMGAPCVISAADAKGVFAWTP